VSSEGKAVLSALLPPNKAVVVEGRVNEIALDLGDRRPADVFHEEPPWLRLSNASLKLRDQVLRQLPAGSFNQRRKGSPMLARGAAQDAIKLPWWWVEALDIPSPQQVRPPDDAETIHLKGQVQQPDTWKEGEHQAVIHG
jgi:hypothetical protein